MQSIVGDIYRLEDGYSLVLDVHNVNETRYEVLGLYLDHKCWAFCSKSGIINKFLFNNKYGPYHYEYSDESDHLYMMPFVDYDVNEYGNSISKISQFMKTLTNDVLHRESLNTVVFCICSNSFKFTNEYVSCGRDKFYSFDSIDKKNIKEVFDTIDKNLDELIFYVDNMVLYDDPYHRFLSEPRPKVNSLSCPMFTYSIS